MTPSPTTTAPTKAAAPENAPQVFLAPLRSAALDGDTRMALEDALLVELRRGGLRVVGSGDLRGLLEVEATRQAAGCDSDSCAAELADALGAPEIVTSQVARVGDTWVFSVARLVRGNLVVVARAQRTVRGGDVSVLLDVVPALVDELTGGRSRRSDNATGPVVTAVGVGIGVVGALCWAGSAVVYNTASAQANEGQFDEARDTIDIGRPLNWAGIVGGIVGGLVATTGGALWWFGENP
jgi:hypothetical protein